MLEGLLQTHAKLGPILTAAAAAAAESAQNGGENGQAEGTDGEADDLMLVSLI